MDDYMYDLDISLTCTTMTIHDAREIIQSIVTDYGDVSETTIKLSRQGVDKDAPS